MRAGQCGSGTAAGHVRRGGSRAARRGTAAWRGTCGAAGVAYVRPWVPEPPGAEALRVP
jgi:hypothetical protein